NEEDSGKNKYQIVEYVPKQSRIPYKNFQIYVYLEKVLKPINLEDITIKNLDGEDISDSFTKRIVESKDGSNRKVLIVTPDPLVLNSDISGGGVLYDAYQVIEIPVELDYSSNYSEFENIEKKEISVPAEAEAFFGMPVEIKSEKPGYAKFTNQSTVSIKYIDNLNRQFIETEVYEDRRYGLSWRILGTESQQGKPYFYEGDKLLVRLEIVDRNRPNIWTEKGTIKIPYNTDLLEAPTEIKFYRIKSPDNRIPPGDI